MTVIRLLAQVQNEIPIVSIAMASQNMARLVAISKRVDALEAIVDPSARILRGLTPVHEPHILPEPELLVPARELPTLVLQ